MIIKPWDKYAPTKRKTETEYNNNEKITLDKITIVNFPCN